MSRAAWLAGALLALSTLACIDDGIPPRPSDVNPSDGGVTQLASSPNCGGIDLVVVGETLYWTERATGKLKSIPTAGGATTIIESGQPMPGPLAVDGASIFWANGGTKTLMKKPLAGGATTVFVAATTVPEEFGDENDINALLVDDGMLYIGRYTYVLKVPTTGGMPKVIGHSPDSDLGIPSAFAIDATHLYQTEINHNAISREALDGTQNGLVEGGAMQPFAPDRLAVSQGPDFLWDALSVVNGYVIWGSAGVVKTKPVDDLESTKAAQIATSSESFNKITGLVVSGNTIIFGEAGDDDVLTTPLTTGIAADAPNGTVIPAGIVIARSQQSPGQFAADDLNVYWRTADCKIVRMTKP